MRSKAKTELISKSYCNFAQVKIRPPVNYFANHFAQLKISFPITLPRRVEGFGSSSMPRLPIYATLPQLYRNDLSARFGLEGNHPFRTRSSCSFSSFIVQNMVKANGKRGGDDFVFSNLFPPSIQCSTFHFSQF